MFGLVAILLFDNKKFVWERGVKLRGWGFRQKYKQVSEGRDFNKTKCVKQI